MTLSGGSRACLSGGSRACLSGCSLARMSGFDLGRKDHQPSLIFEWSCLSCHGKEKGPDDRKGCRAPSSTLPQQRCTVKETLASTPETRLGPLSRTVRVQAKKRPETGATRSGLITQEEDETAERPYRGVACLSVRGLACVSVRRCPT
jgi:hypothetical protein